MLLQDEAGGGQEFVASRYRIAASVPVRINALPIQAMDICRIIFRKEATWASLGVTAAILRTTDIEVCIGAVRVLAEGVGSVRPVQVVWWASHRDTGALSDTASIIVLSRTCGINAFDHCGIIS
jgi:hypothetical protein